MDLNSSIFFYLCQFYFNINLKEWQIQREIIYSWNAGRGIWEYYIDVQQTSFSKCKRGRRRGMGEEEEGGGKGKEKGRRKEEGRRRLIFDEINHNLEKG